MTIENLEQYRGYLENIINDGLGDLQGGDVESPVGFYAGVEVGWLDTELMNAPPSGWYIYRRNSDGIVSLFYFKTVKKFFEEFDRLEQIYNDAEEAEIEDELAAFVVGVKVKIVMGIDDGKTGIVVPRSQVPLRGGIPDIDKGHYKPMDRRSVAIRLDHDDSLDVYSLRHLQVIVTENSSPIVTGTITFTLEMPEDQYNPFMKELRDLLYKQTGPDTILVVDPQIEHKK